MIETIIKKLEHNNDDIQAKELIYLLNNLEENTKEQLLQAARRVKEQQYSNRVFMRGLIEFSNYCKQNCKYCGIRRDNTKADRYRLTEAEILECCDLGYELGYKTFVLQSGEDNYFTDEKLIKIIESIKTQYPECAVTLSVGEKSKASYEKFYKAGADRYLLRHETAAKDLYASLHPGMSFDNRRRCLFDLKEIGYQVGAGFMVGLPGQTTEDLVKDLMFLKALQPEMVGIGPYLTHPETPLKDFEQGSLEMTLIMLALVRLILPEVLLPATTAMGTIHNYGREKALLAGGNVVMPNLSPTTVREKYELYSDKICTGDLATHCRKCIEGRINSVGYAVDLSRGDHKNWRRKHV